MTFSEKLKQAMQELHLNQRQVCGMTGKSKGSVSQYLSGNCVVVHLQQLCSLFHI